MSRATHARALSALSLVSCLVPYLAIAFACAAPTRAQAQAAGDVEDSPASEAQAPPASSSEPEPRPPTPGELSALLDSAVLRLSEEARADAEKKLAERDYPGGLQLLERAHELDPSSVGTLRRLAELHVLLGHAERAEALYRSLLAREPKIGQAYAALADLLFVEGAPAERLREGAELYAMARERLGAEPALLRKQARLARARGDFERAQHHYKELVAAGRVDDALRVELGDFHREAGHPDEALKYYRQVSGEKEARLAAQRIFELEVEREAQRFGLSRTDPRRNEEVQRALDDVRVLVGQGEQVKAEALLRQALAKRPEQARLHGALAELLRSDQRLEAAELEYLRAIALDGGDPHVHLRLAELYLEGKPPQAGTAAWLIERALSLRPDLAGPHLLLARAYQTLGDLPRALLHVTRYVSLVPASSARDEAVAMQAGLQALLGSGAPDPAKVGIEPSSSQEPFARARAFVARGQTDAALAELRRVRDPSQLTEAHKLEARVLFAAGRYAEAETVLLSLLERDFEQPEVHELLADTLLAAGRSGTARAHLLECEAGGSSACALRLARLDAERDKGFLPALGDLHGVPRLLRARSRLRALEREPSPQVSAADVRALRDDVDARLTVAAVLGALALVLLTGLLWAWQRRRFGGVDLYALLDFHPDAGADAQRILSAIRHEVLKHNTLMLAGVCEAVQRGAPVRDAAEHVLRALFGERDGDREEGGARRRMAVYEEQLVQLARAHGERLNQRRDPLLSSMASGFSQLWRLRHSLLRADKLSVSARERLARRLRQASDALSDRPTEQVRLLLDRVRFLEVDRKLLEDIFDSVHREPALADAHIAPPEIDPESDLPCELLLPRPVFEDMLRNLIRNALQASLRTPGPRPVVVGLSVLLDVDEITGLERVAVHVRDRAKEPLPPEKLRGAYIEAGLGLTADLVARHEGQLELREGSPGYEKAVVLRLAGRKLQREATP